MENSEKIHYFNFKNKFYEEFNFKYRKFTEANGLRVHIKQKDKNKIVKFNPDPKFNAFKYSIRPFTILASLNNLPNKTKNLIWTDSDLRCKNFFSSYNLKELLPDDNQILSYIGGTTGNSDYAFIAFNLKNKNFNEFLKKIINNYITGKIFSYPVWHDTYLWDIAIQELTVLGHSYFKNLAPSPNHKGHLYLNTKLGNFFDHLKGIERKTLGRSFDEDYEQFNKDI